MSRRPGESKTEKDVNTVCSGRWVDESQSERVQGSEPIAQARNTLTLSGRMSYRESECGGVSKSLRRGSEPITQGSPRSRTVLTLCRSGGVGG